MSAELPGIARRPAHRGHAPRRLVALLPMLFLSACSWFTDFKQQPKIDPWETSNDTIAFRGQPQATFKFIFNGVYYGASSAAQP